MSTQPPEQPDHPENNPQEQERPLYSTSSRKPSEVVAVSVTPQAPLQWRLLAAVLDIVLVALFSSMLLYKVLLPLDHSEGMDQYQALTSEYLQQRILANESGVQPPTFDSLQEQLEADPAVMEMAAYIWLVFSLFLVLYFVLCERFMQGGSLGKAMFRLRVFSLRRGGQPSLWESFVRNAVKALTLTSLVLWVGFLFVFFNRLRRALHDWLGHTVVISDIVQVRSLPVPDDSDGQGGSHD